MKTMETFGDTDLVSKVFMMLTKYSIKIDNLGFLAPYSKDVFQVQIQSCLRGNAI